MSWVAVGVAAAGIGTSLVGASNQRSANARAQDQNARLQEQQNAAAWTNYLMSRGVAPTTQLAPGQLPAEGQYRPINSRLPYWANVNLNQIPNQQQAARQPFLVKRAS